MNNIIKYVNTDNLTDDVYCIIDSAQKPDYCGVPWNAGKHILLRVGTGAMYN